MEKLTGPVDLPVTVLIVPDKIVSQYNFETYP